MDGCSRGGSASVTVPRRRGATGGEIHSIYGMSETYAVSLVTRPGTSTGSHTGSPLHGVDVRLESLDGSPVARGDAGDGGAPGWIWRTRASAQSARPRLSSGFSASAFA